MSNNLEGTQLYMLKHQAYMNWLWHSFPKRRNRSYKF